MSKSLSLFYSLKLKLVLIAVCVLVAKSAVCQINISTFEEYAQVQKNLYLINPSAFDTSYSSKITVNFQQNLGLFSNVTKSYLEADKKIKSSKSNDLHWVGIQITNAQFGDYINKNRAYGRYSWMTPLNDKLLLSGGIYMGIVNFSFLTTQGVGGGSSIGLDGGVGVRLLGRKRQLGLATQQIFKTVITPINQSFYLPRLYNVDYRRFIELSPSVNVNTQAVLQLIADNQFLASYGADIIVKNNYSLGVNYHTAKRLSVQASYLNINIEQYFLGIQALYTIYNSSLNLSSNAIEILVSISKK